MKTPCAMTTPPTAARQAKYGDQRPLVLVAVAAPFVVSALGFAGLWWLRRWEAASERWNDLMDTL